MRAAMARMLGLGMFAMLCAAACGEDDADLGDAGPTTTTANSGCISPPHPWYSGNCVIGDGCGTCMSPDFICDDREPGKNHSDNDQWAACICAIAVCATECDAACNGEPDGAASNNEPLDPTCAQCIRDESATTGKCAIVVTCAL